MKLKAINIGCGKELMTTEMGYEWINADRKPMHPNVQQVDFTLFPLPFQDNTLDFVRMKCILEHIPCEKQLSLLEEIHRISKNRARIWIRVPYKGQWMRKIDHYRGYTYNTFRHLNRYWYVSNSKLSVVFEDDVPTKFGRIFLHKKIREIFSQFTDNLIKDIIVELEVQKDILRFNH